MTSYTSGTEGPFPVLHVQTFGRVGASVVTAPNVAATPILAAGKPLALVVYLACAPGHLASRDHLASLLWSSDEQADARHSLRQLILRLRQLLGPESIETTRDTARLAITCAIDRKQFLDAIDANSATQALDVYGGLFLPEMSFPGGREFDDWVAVERAALSRRFQVAGQQQVIRLLDAGRPRDAIALARRVRDDQPLEEAAWRPLLEALLSANDRLGAAVEIEALEAMLGEAGAEPAAATRLLLARFRNDSVRNADTKRGLVAELVGREREFSAILSRWEEVRRSRLGHHVHVEGDAGIGKSRLLDDVSRRLAMSGARVVRVPAAEGDAGIPWSVLARMAQALSTLPGARGVAPECARHLVGLNPALSATFSASSPIDGDTTANARVRALAVADLLEAVADERHVVLLLDDLHWWDTASREALALVAAASISQSLLLLTASRRASPALAPPERTSSLRLAPLEEGQLETFVCSIAIPESAAWGRRLARALFEGCSGNPLFALEALRQVIGTGLLAVDAGEWRSPQFDEALSQLRAGNALRSHVEGLGAHESWILLLLAVAGRPLPAELLLDASSLGEAANAVVDHLVRDRLVERADGLLRTAHDLIASQAIERTPRDLVDSAGAVLGRAFGARPESVESVRIALVYLIAAHRLDESAALVEAFVRHRRTVGDRRGLESLLDELRIDGGNALREALARRLPWRERWPHWRAFAAMTVTSALLLLAIGIKGARPTLPPPLTLGVAVGGGDSLRLIRLDVDTSAAADGQPIRIDEGVTVATLRPRRAFAGFPRLGPANAGIVLHGFTGDSGGFDIYRLLLSGQRIRLTAARGDDIDPDWSPDGRFVVFQTSRWAPRASTVAHLAVLELATGTVRAITDGAVQDGRPRWAPDGTRIAFLRRPLSPAADSASICWVPVRGGPPRCHRSRIDARAALHSWTDDEHVIAGDPRAGNTVVLHHLDSGVEEPLSTGLLAAIDVSPEQWAVGWRSRATDWEVRRSSTRAGRPLVSKTDSIDFVSWWTDQTQANPVVRLEPATGEPLPVGVGLAMFPRAQRADGSTRVLVPDVLRWSSRSPRVQVELDGRRVRALDSGTVWLHADVGGWLQDSVQVHFTKWRVDDLQRESWNDTLFGQWQRFGEPLPAITRFPVGPALLVRGDETFVSGVLSRSGWSVRRGLGVEFLVSVPIGRDAWQRLQLELVTQPSVVLGGVSSRLACGWHFPAQEEPNADRRAGVLLGVDSTAFVPTAGFGADARWHRVRVQWLPDGSCGVAVDGQVVARGGPREVPVDRAHVVISGQSVGTTVAVRDVRVWRGVADGVRW